MRGRKSLTERRLAGLRDALRSSKWPLAKMETRRGGRLRLYADDAAERLFQFGGAAGGGARYVCGHVWILLCGLAGEVFTGVIDGARNSPLGKL